MMLNDVKFGPRTSIRRQWLDILELLSSFASCCKSHSKIGGGTSSITDTFNRTSARKSKYPEPDRFWHFNHLFHLPLVKAP